MGVDRLTFGHAVSRGIATRRVTTDGKWDDRYSDRGHCLGSLVVEHQQSRQLTGCWVNNDVHRACRGAYAEEE
jgi:hypothetical protein